MSRDVGNLDGFEKGNSPSNSSPCLRHGCVACCIETEMPLIEDDLKRIEKLGYKRVEFTLQVEGETRLSNRGKSCFFLKDGKCKIYYDRPEGCKIYPLVYDIDTHKFVYDSVCPHGTDFRVTHEDKERLKRLIKKLDREATNK